MTETVTFGAVVTVTLAEPDAVVSCTDTAVTVNVVGEGVTVVGAV